VEQAFCLFHDASLVPTNYQNAVDLHKRAKALKQKRKEKNEAFNVGGLSATYNLYTEAPKIHPNNKSANAILFFKMTKVCSKLSRLIDAVSDFSSALDLEWNCLNILLWRAKCYTEVRDFNEAARDYEKAFKIDIIIESRRLLKRAKLALKKFNTKIITGF
jgi:DnaJ family protein C protein 7